MGSWGRNKSRSSEMVAKKRTPLQQFLLPVTRESNRGLSQAGFKPDNDDRIDLTSLTCLEKRLEDLQSEFTEAPSIFISILSETNTNLMKECPAITGMQELNRSEYIVTGSIKPSSEAI